MACCIDKSSFLKRLKDTDNPDLIQMIVVVGAIEKACGD